MDFYIKFVEIITKVSYSNIKLCRILEERKAMELALIKSKEAAENASQSKSQFLAKMSHELRTPLNPILGFTELLCEASNLTAEQRQWMRIVNQRGEDLLSMIGDILDLSKIEAGKIEIEKQFFSLKDAVRDIVDSIRPSAQRKKLHLEWEVNADISAPIFTDELRLRQMLLNLLNNALKFTQTGSIRVKVEKGHLSSISRALNPGEMVLQFSVQDTGLGIPPSRQAAIFEEFTHADNKHGVKYGGAGLGLAIVKQLVKRMGGNIWLESEEGRGSTFFFTIIAGYNDTVAPLPQESVHSATPSSEKSLRILVVDDDACCRQLVKEILHKNGYEMKCVSNGRSALQLLEKENPFDVILMDIGMPGMNGVEATQAIRKLDSQTGKHTFIVAVTGYAMESEKRQFMEAGMDEFLAKPIQMTKLTELMQQISLRI